MKLREERQDPDFRRDDKAYEGNSMKARPGSCHPDESRDPVAIARL